MSFDSVFYADFEYQSILFVNENPTRKNDGHFSKTLFFLVFDHFRLFWIFRPEKSFQKKRRTHIRDQLEFLYRMMHKKSKINFMESLLTVHLTKNPCWFSASPISGKPHSPPTAHICFDRSFVALSNVIPHYVQSSLLMEFLGLEYPAIERVSRDPPSSDGSKNF